MKTALAVVAVLLSMSAGAKPVYKCEEGGTITFTDQPCAPGARAAELPDLVITAPPTPSQQDLARSHDARLGRERAARAREDAEWLKQHAAAEERAARVRKAILEHRVIRGMTFAEVKRALGEPDQVSSGDSYGTDKASWVYRRDGRTRTVNFKNGEVTSTSARGRK